MAYEGPDGGKIFGAGKKYDIVTPGSPYYNYTPLQQRNLLWSPIKGWKSYDNVFPNAQLKYEPLKNLVFRAAYSTNIGRPDLGNILPSTNIQSNVTKITLSNPALKPQTGKNIDLKVEYYLPKYNGVLSLTAFRQETKGYIVNVTSYTDTIACLM